MATFMKEKNHLAFVQTWSYFVLLYQFLMKIIIVRAINNNCTKLEDLKQSRQHQGQSTLICPQALGFALDLCSKKPLD